MTAETHAQLANFIWGICNLLRGPYKRNEYRKVILPLTVLRRFDSLLAPTKAQVLEEYKTLKIKPETVVRSLLQKTTGRPFYNLSKLDFTKLLDDPNQLAPNLNSYINGFSKNVRDIMERFAFDQQITKMAEKNLLYEVIKVFAKIDLSPDRVDNVQMGYGRFLLPHLPVDRDTTVLAIGDEVGLQYYRLERISSGAIEVREGDPQGVKSPTDVGTGKDKDKKAPLSEIIQVLNDKFGTNFSEADRLFFEQIKAKAVNDDKIISTARANPLDKFQLGIRKMIEDLMLQRMTDNDKIVTRYMDDPDFQNSAFPILSREIFEAVRAAIPTETAAAASP